MADVKWKAAVVGATGMVGQRFVSLLADHPWFEVSVVAASPSSAGKTYSQAVQGRWAFGWPVPDAVKDLTVMDASQVQAVCDKADLVFCAVDMPKEQIRALEEAYAKCEVPVISNNSANRWTPDVPMLIPELNPDHAQVIAAQKKRLGTEHGFIAVKPNCSIQSYVPALHPLLDFGIEEINVVTVQAISGAGKTFETFPDIVDNVIPFIGGEEEKSEQEPLRIWGKVQDGAIVPAKDIRISAQCLRGPVADGHMAAVSVKFAKKPTKDEILARWAAFETLPQQLNLPSAPKPFLQYFQEDNRPQTKLDRDFGNGMGVSVGRLREDTLFDYKFICLSHNTLRGAAGGGVLSAELLASQGLIPHRT